MKLDQVCADAVEIARAAVTEDVAGAHLDVVAEGERLVTHYFECMMSGYRGWRWAVTVARVSRSKQVTICETVLLPGPDALTVPDWVPWNERVQPGDLGVGDLMPTAADDERLVPGYLLSDDPAVDDAVWELGLGRVRVLSREGRLDAAERWYEGDAGPHAAITTAAPANARCVSCGFFLPLAGSMSAMFGACANVYAPDDGRVVSNDHGCGAHSEVLVEQVVEVDEAPTIYDDAEVEPVIAEAESTTSDMEAVAVEVSAEAEIAVEPQAEEPATVEDQPAVAEDQLTLLEDQPTLVEDQLTVIEDQNATDENQSSAVEDEPTAYEDQITADEDQPTVDEYQPTADKETQFLDHTAESIVADSIAPEAVEELEPAAFASKTALALDAEFAPEAVSASEAEFAPEAALAFAPETALVPEAEFTPETALVPEAMFAQETVEPTFEFEDAEQVATETSEPAEASAPAEFVSEEFEPSVSEAAEESTAFTPEIAAPEAALEDVEQIDSALAEFAPEEIEPPVFEAAEEPAAFTPEIAAPETALEDIEQIDSIEARVEEEAEQAQAEQAQAEQAPAEEEAGPEAEAAEDQASAATEPTASHDLTPSHAAHEQMHFEVFTSATNESVEPVIPHDF